MFPFAISHWKCDCIFYLGKNEYAIYNMCFYIFEQKQILFCSVHGTFKRDNSQVYLA